jgi:hypothetical protein
LKHINYDRDGKLANLAAALPIISGKEKESTFVNSLARTKGEIFTSFKTQAARG